MNNFGRHSRREIAMSRPLASHKNHAQPRPDGVPPTRPCLRRRGAFRSARELITCRHFIMGFY